MNRWIAITVAVGAARASAGPDDVAAVRAQLPDPGARCTLGALYAQRGDLPRAQLFLEGCGDDSPEADVGKKLRASELSELSIVSDPPGMAVETDALPGEHLTTPATVWARAGTYEVRATRLDGTQLGTSITLAAHSRGSIVLSGSPARRAGPHAGTVWFGDQGDVGDRSSGPPPDAKHKALMPSKFVDGGTIGGAQIDDPLAAPADRPPPATPAFALGLRAGGGSYAGGIGPALALTAAVRARDAELPLLVVARAEWTRRGAPDQLALGAGVAQTLAATDTAWLLAGGELRAAHELSMGRSGLGAVARLGLTLRRLPLALDVAFEQGLTAPHDRAIVIEAGFDVR